MGRDELGKHCRRGLVEGGATGRAEDRPLSPPLRPKAAYLLIAVPWIGTPLPLTKTIIAVTLIAGLLPVVGNLISNTIIVVVSLSVSPLLAVTSLAFLVVIHKLEYFVNARVMGGQIRAQAWELLAAMLVMDSIFGIPGLVAAPVYYAYLKNELSAERLI